LQYYLPPKYEKNAEGKYPAITNPVISYPYTAIFVLACNTVAKYPKIIGLIDEAIHIKKL
jgi:hypothetical protein